MIITYEGTDIAPLTAVRKCVYEAREEGRVPELRIEFDDGSGTIDAWAPQPGDRVSVSADGAPATGDMYVKSCLPVMGGYVIRADALPVADVRASRTWKNTTLYVVAAQIAKKLGCKVKVHGCDNMSFSFVAQSDECALPVLARICSLAGAVFDVYGGTIHISGRKWAASQKSSGVLEVPPTARYAYSNGEPYTACAIEQTAISGLRKKIAASAGTSGRTLSIVLDPRIGVPGTKELKRACSGVLATANGRISGGWAMSDSLSPFTPGARCTVESEQAASLSGEAIVTRVRNDYATGNSKTWWRKL